MKKIVIFALILVPFVTSMTLLENQISVVGYSTSIDVSGAVFLIDISHDPFHTSFERLYSNLTSSGNAVIITKGNIALSDNVDVLFLPDSGLNFTTTEKEMIDNWINQGDKLLIMSGDSDYGGYYDPICNNEVLDYIGSQIRLDSTMISDPVFNDGASYRVAATEYGTTPTASILSSGCDAGIMMHSPCAVLGYDGVDHIDMRDTTLPNVEVLISYSANATSGDSDDSSLPTDLYANDPDNGDYPAVVYEKIATTSGDNSHIIVSGEAIYSDYKDMYDQKTETGVYNGGTQYGQKFVNNIINYFVESKINPENVITILSDADFINYGFLGSGTAEDPYIIENYVYNGSVMCGVYIGDTTKYAVIQNCDFINLVTGIIIDGVLSGTIDILYNNFKNNVVGVGVLDYDSILIKNNFFNGCSNGIQFQGTTNGRIERNNLQDGLLYAIILDYHSESNEIFSNNFINNSAILPTTASQAYDGGTDNSWHNNYWSDWNGTGAYDIDGIAGAQDISPSSQTIAIKDQDTGGMTIDFPVLHVIFGFIAISVIFIRKIRK